MDQQDLVVRLVEAVLAGQQDTRDLCRSVVTSNNNLSSALLESQKDSRSNMLSVLKMTSEVSENMQSMTTLLVTCLQSFQVIDDDGNEDDERQARRLKKPKT